MEIANLLGSQHQCLLEIGRLRRPGCGNPLARDLPLRGHMPIEAGTPLSQGCIATRAHIVYDALDHLRWRQAFAHTGRNRIEQRRGHFDFVEGHAFEHTGVGSSEVGINRDRHLLYSCALERDIAQDAGKGIALGGEIILRWHDRNGIAPQRTQVAYHR